MSNLTDAFSMLATARKSAEMKRRLKEVLPLVGVMTLVFVVLCVAWSAFNVGDARELVMQLRSKGVTITELQSLSHDANDGFPVRPNVGDDSARGSVGELLEDEDPFPIDPNNSISLANASNNESLRLVKTGLPPYYRLGKPIEDWDKQRKLWFEKHPSVKNQTDDGRPRLFMLTGSQPERCRASTGDYLMLRTFKNKVDYCRLHDIGIFYNLAILDRKMDNFWSKLPLLRAAMEAHPEAEWLWWVDADLFITDMEFEIPLERYAAYNLVVPGWEKLVFLNRSAVGLNAGSFLVRNCGWTMKFLERWASMGPKGKINDKAGKIQSAFLWNRNAEYPSDDQSALIYFMVKEREVWGEKILLEDSYDLSGYWLDVVGGMEAVEEAEEKQGKGVAAIGEREAMEAAAGRRSRGRGRRSFVTHFAGCQICNGNSNPAFKKGACTLEMERALRFADNQVLRAFGFRHPSLNTNDVNRLP